MSGRLWGKGKHQRPRLVRERDTSSTQREKARAQLLLSKIFGAPSVCKHHCKHHGSSKG